MKINIEIDITPLEARSFLGLPDVGPMQEEVLAQMKKKALEGLDNFDPTKVDPTKIMENYFSLYPKWMESFSKMAEKR
ncbi:MAG: hypothetical protein HQL72_07075 [Magnetococcales bacterium]|nr:hypothetical protein [Magnetococcales bacterium]